MVRQLFSKLHACSHAKGTIQKIRIMITRALNMSLSSPLSAIPTTMINLAIKTPQDTKRESHKCHLYLLPHAPCCHMRTLLTVRPRLSPSPHVWYHRSLLSQNSLAAFSLPSPQGLLPTISLKKPLVPPTAT